MTYHSQILFLKYFCFFNLVIFIIFFIFIWFSGKIVLFNFIDFHIISSTEFCIWQYKISYPCRISNSLLNIYLRLAAFSTVLNVTVSRNMRISSILLISVFSICNDVTKKADTRMTDKINDDIMIKTKCHYKLAHSSYANRQNNLTFLIYVPVLSFSASAWLLSLCVWLTS